jgi:hypothetical protein
MEKISGEEIIVHGWYWKPTAGEDTLNEDQKL